jgi:poly-beta-1,6-N-acetyl-D-glucosamine synthase
MQAVWFLSSLDTRGLVLLFWYMVVLELPRYSFGALAACVDAACRRPPPPVWPQPTVSVLLVGHNEAHALRRCALGLAEQSLMRQRSLVQVVVVDDGSTDGMSRVAQRLRAEKLIDDFLTVSTRGGKSAGVNLGLTVCRGDVVVILDIDTTLDRNAIERMLPYFRDPRVGAVSGDIGVRNARDTLVTRHQEIEYLISISLGRRIGDLLGTLSIVSGAFGAFRRTAVLGVGGQDVEVGEDADLTMKLRRAGWRIRFAPESRALTAAPETMPRLIAQRLRWDRGIVTIWLRKFRGTFDPRSNIFRLIDVFALLDVLVFQLILTLVFPVYVVWLWYTCGWFSLSILAATLICYVVLDCLALLTATLLSPYPQSAWLPVYMPVHVMIELAVMRVVRLIAILQELLFRSSYRDPYVPARVMRQAEYL